MRELSYSICWICLKSKSSLHFCQECNNLLYPKADPQRRIMVYGCRICQYDELVDNKCVYRNDLLTVTKCVFVMYVCHFFWPHVLREQVGVTTDLGADATLVWCSTHSGWEPVLRSRDRLIPTFHAHGVVTMSKFINYCPPFPYLVCCSSVFYQDQSKRKETRMILFFVCTKCNHSFTDPTLPTDSRPEMEDA